MNDEKKIAQAILDAQKMREESYCIPDGNTYGEYKLDIADCLITTCKEQGLSENLWALLNLAMHWWNDIQLWAEDVLAGKNILAMLQRVETSPVPCCNTPSKDHCEQCQEIGLANPLNH